MDSKAVALVQDKNQTIRHGEPDAMENSNDIMSLLREISCRTLGLDKSACSSQKQHHSGGGHEIHGRRTCGANFVSFTSPGRPGIDFLWVPE
jgi:hypothetical protein